MCPPTARTVVTMIDGEVELANALGAVVISGGEQGVAEAGRAPLKTAVLNAANVIQWNLYYPGVLDPAELELSPQERETLAPSLAAYSRGELLEALKLYSANHQPASAGDHLYLGGLLLAVGMVDQSLQQLEPAASGNGNNPALANALRELIAAVKFERWDSTNTPALATEYLAESYYQQSRANLAGALTAARKAVEKSPSFGFGWERVAELEFSYGHTDAAQKALEKSLTFAPRNPQAFTLKGFILSAQNRIPEAIQNFDEAIVIDGALGNAWLGRGLCRIHSGQAVTGREDLEVAAALEPNRAVLRSYLGKAFNETHDYTRAEHELALARKFDPNDPTSWLYSALLHQQDNQINLAIRDLEQSQALNDNRSVYRSQMLLDQDASVRGANLAGIYQDAGMEAVSVREATRAVNYDYANYSAHLFLANSYNQLRDPNQINLRYETPWLNEYLVANLLAPVGAGTLSQTVSQQEYSKLFEHDKFGAVSSTEYFSDGNWIQSGSQYGTVGNFGYAVDSYYLSSNGQRPNNGQQQLTVSAQIKYDATPRDSFFSQTTYYNATAGDLTQYYNQSQADVSLNTEETQLPLALVGYRHEWSPGNYTLMLAGRFDDNYSVNTTNEPVLLLANNSAGQVIAVPTPSLPTAPLNYNNRLVIYSGELQQIWEQADHTLIVGARYQYGTFNTQSALGASTPTRLASMINTTVLYFASSPISQSAATDLERITGYGYYFWRILDPLQLEAGVSYDVLTYPLNHQLPPISGAKSFEAQVSPKAGFTWTPTRDTTVRFAYTRSLGGVSFDQSIRLEPSQVAGFIQSYRSLIPGAIAGSTAGATFDTYGLAVEQKFKTGTYLGFEGQLLDSDVNQSIGVVNLNFPPTYSPSVTPQSLNYQEADLVLTANQLLGDCWSLGAQYQLSDVQLKIGYPDIPGSVTSASQSQNDATLQQVGLFALFNHPSGFFARAEANWYGQSNSGYQPALPGDDFWQFNLFGGYRFFHRHAQVMAGLLNITGQNYQLNPLNLYTDLPRHRTLAASFQFNF